MTNHVRNGSMLLFALSFTLVELKQLKVASLPTRDNINFRPPPEIGQKMARKWILASPGKEKKDGPKNRKKSPQNSPKSHSWAIFPILEAIFSLYFPREAKIHLRARFSPKSTDWSLLQWGWSSCAALRWAESPIANR